MYAPDEKGQVVLRALENPKYNWRTIKGIAAETGLDEALVTQIVRGLSMVSGQIVQSSVPDSEGRPLFTTRKHYYESSSLANRLLSVFSDRIK